MTWGWINHISSEINERMNLEGSTWGPVRSMTPWESSLSTVSLWKQTQGSNRINRQRNVGVTLIGGFHATSDHGFIGLIMFATDPCLMPLVVVATCVAPLHRIAVWRGRAWRLTNGAKLLTDLHCWSGTLQHERHGVWNHDQPVTSWI